ncbi:hypothetical protein HMPREF1988_02090 [Porphyromonas gingivalis F0185]|nr:hypothetical protein HMPREF1988_02090 [Porphyromonas gingivalis F0185]
MKIKSFSILMFREMKQDQDGHDLAVRDLNLSILTSNRYCN